jgi:hypothetical protein
MSRCTPGIRVPVVVSGVWPASGAAIRQSQIAETRARATLEKMRDKP